MRKIVIVIGNLNTGGAQSVVCKLAENIDKNLYDTSIVCCRAKNNTAIETRVEGAVPVHYLGINEGFSIRDFLKFNKALRRIKPDAVHAHLGGVQYAILWAMLHHRKVVVTAHTTPEKAFTRRTEKLLRYGLKKRLVVLVAVSEENKEKCAKYFDLDNKRCRLVNNGVDIHEFVPFSRHEPFVFINVATHDKNKNQLALLKCLQKVREIRPNVKLLLVGNGPEHESLIRFTEDQNLTEAVIFTGEVNNPEKYYSQADVYVQSSHREAMPMSILEALSYGLPVISTDVGGIKDVVNGNGELIADNDIEAFSKAMVLLLTMPRAAFELLREKSYEIVASYSSSLMAEEYGKIYESTYQ